MRRNRVSAKGVGRLPAYSEESGISSAGDLLRGFERGGFSSPSAHVAGDLRRVGWRSPLGVVEPAWRGGSPQSTNGSERESQEEEMKRYIAGVVAVVFVSFLALGSVAYSQGAGKMTYGPYVGIAKLTGDGSEYWKMGFTVGGTAFYPVTSKILVGGRLGYTRFTPDEDKLKEQAGVLPGMSVDISGSFSSIEIVPTARYMVAPSGSKLGVFGQVGFGYYLMKVKTEVTGSYMGYSYTESAEESENKPGLSLGAGVHFAVGQMGVEVFPVYNIIFTEDESTKYYSINVSVMF